MNTAVAGPGDLLAMNSHAYERSDAPCVDIARAGPRHPGGRSRPRCVRTTLGGARDAAFILLGYAGALPIGELAALALDDLESRPDGIVLRIRRSKTDRNAAGSEVAVARGQHPDTDPITALQHWLRLRGTTAGPVFVPLHRAGVPIARIAAQTRPKDLSVLFDR